MEKKAALLNRIKENLWALSRGVLTSFDPARTMVLVSIKVNTKEWE
ncbi:hypothetical protein [Limosilactobacillus sp.]